MNEDQIKRILSCVHNCYVCAINELKFTSIYPSFYIVNTAERLAGGEHWICLVFDQEENSTICYYFDSLAGFPEVVCPQIISFVRQNAQRIHFNGRRLQNPINATCGLFSCYLVLSYQNKFDFCKFLLRFDQRSESLNDLSLFKRFWKLLRNVTHDDVRAHKSVTNLVCKSIKEAITG
jgi:Adenovirus endoprotease